MHKQLTATGAALAILGVVLLVFALGVADQTEMTSSSDMQQPGGADPRAQPMVLTVAAGLCLAAGAGLIGIGANRWYTYRGRTTRG